ncbi:transglycosylase domain-containing protein [Microbacterium sp. JZ31]|uniref:transglycosylase domain-containing protein n=1 Tax=Microbacterium sp. JZ31 TaxID=1906274 RepID=UPI001932D562|nr:transglycosylase domain-containing protein [Microbacterium sp. JZ31]
MPLGKRTASGVLGGVLGLVGLSAVAGVLVTATVTPAIAVSGYAASSAITLFDKLPSYLEVDQPMLPTTIYVDDPNSDEPYELASFYDQNRTPVSWDEVPQVMYDSILSSEDPRYYEHGGVDLIGTARALVNNAGGGDTQGGSSISQQYVKNVLIQECEKDSPDQETLLACWTKYTTADGAEGYERKLQEMRYAIAIEKEYSKNDILLGYLNIANFGGVTYGIEAAAQYYFGVSAKDLTIVQAATLAGIVQNPNYYRIDQPDNEVNGEANGYAATKDRRNYVLTRLYEDGKITEAEYTEAHAAPIEPSIHPREKGCTAAGGSAYFCQYVKTVIESDPNYGPEALRRGGLNVYTTLDLKVQLPAEQAMRDYAPATLPGMDFGATAVTLEADTGKIRAMAQNTTFSEDPDVAKPGSGYSAQVYAADQDHGSSRGFSVGSTFKVFTLLDWLEKGHSINERLNGVNRTSFEGFNCDGAPIPQTSKIQNFNNVGGYTGSITNFTRDSLNSGYLAMASRLNLCDIMRVADRLDVQTGDGKYLVTDKEPNIERTPVPFDILGSFNVAPMTMASVYATIANNGIQCEPKAIEKITNAEGEEQPLPETTCEQKLAPEVAATAAAALASVMNGGTGAPAKAYDAVPVIGKTGTHEREQTSMVQTSTKASTFVWVGNVSGHANLFQTYAPADVVSNLRYRISSAVQGAANAVYPGGQFPPADPNLSRLIMADLPSVVGQTVDQAKNTLWNAGFNPVVGEPVAGTQAEGLIESQDPGAGRVAAGTTVTIRPSNGKGGTVPDVQGSSLSDAMRAISGAGFDAERGECEQKKGAGAGRVTGTNPGGGEVAPQGTTVSVNYEAAKCSGDDD